MNDIDIQLVDKSNSILFLSAKVKHVVAFSPYIFHFRSEWRSFLLLLNSKFHKIRIFEFRRRGKRLYSDMFRSAVTKQLKNNSLDVNFDIELLLDS